MKAAVVKALGTPPVYADFPDPQDRDGAVVATVEAAALKNLDRVMVRASTTAAPTSRCPWSLASTGSPDSTTGAWSTPTRGRRTG